MEGTEQEIPQVGTILSSLNQILVVLHEIAPGPNSLGKFPVLAEGPNLPLQNRANLQLGSRVQPQGNLHKLAM